MDRTVKVLTKGELLNSINTVSEHPEATAWEIYRYLCSNYRSLQSGVARKLLAIYLEIDLPRPSLIHSYFLSLALKFVRVYEDFRLPSFLRMWNYPDMLRPEDRNVSQTSQGISSNKSLKEQVELTLHYYNCQQSRKNAHPSKSTTELGREGEELAVKYLQNKGYYILDRNWHNRGHKELDIIARKDETIVFVEVKTRKSNSLTSPMSAITYDKRRRITLAAQSYILCNRYNQPFRFDVIGIVGYGESAVIEHVENAFPPCNKRFY